MNTKSKQALSFILLLAIIALPAVAMAFDQNSEACVAMRTVKDAVVMVGATIAIIGWVIAGILYLTSAGGERMGTAKKALFAAVIGTALVIIGPTAYNVINSLLNGMGKYGAGCG